MTRAGWQEAWFALAFAVLSRYPRITRLLGWAGPNTEPEVL